MSKNFKEKVKKLFDKILDLLYPYDVSCGMCGEEIINAVGSGLCEVCSEKIIGIDEPGAVYDRLAVYSYTHYEGVARKIVLKEKDSDKPYLTSTTAYYLNKLIKDFNIKADYLTYVPSSKRNLKRRGYDAMKILVNKLSSLTGIPVLNGVKRIKESIDQTEMETTDERADNVKDCFLYDGIDIEGKRILIVDDVVTTGVTLNECASVLRKKNPLRVSGITFCRAAHR